MKINLAWLLVPAMPFVVATFGFLIIRFCGVPVTEDLRECIAFISALVGGCGSIIMICAIADKNLPTDWTITIGKERD